MLFPLFATGWYQRQQRYRWQNLPPVSLIYQWCTLNCQYLHDFSKKFEMTLMLLSGVWGKMIHEKNVKQKTTTTSQNVYLVTLTLNHLISRQWLFSPKQIHFVYIGVTLDWNCKCYISQCNTLLLIIFIYWALRWNFFCIWVITIACWGEGEVPGGNWTWACLTANLWPTPQNLRVFSNML